MSVTVKEIILPRDGERILFCSHFEVTDERLFLAPERGAVEWWYVGDDNEVTNTANGETFPVRWAALCGECHREIKGSTDAASVQRLITQDGRWIGSPPEIMRLV